MSDSDSSNPAIDMFPNSDSDDDSDESDRDANDNIELMSGKPREDPKTHKLKDKAQQKFEKVKDQIKKRSNKTKKGKGKGKGRPWYEMLNCSGPKGKKNKKTKKGQKGQNWSKGSNKRTTFKSSIVFHVFSCLPYLIINLICYHLYENNDTFYSSSDQTDEMCGLDDVNDTIANWAVVHFWLLMIACFCLVVHLCSCFFYWLECVQTSKYLHYTICLNVLFNWAFLVWMVVIANKEPDRHSNVNCLQLGGVHSVINYLALVSAIVYGSFLVYGWWLLIFQGVFKRYKGKGVECSLCLISLGAVLVCILMWVLPFRLINVERSNCRFAALEIDNEDIGECQRFDAIYRDNSTGLEFTSATFWDIGFIPAAGNEADEADEKELDLVCKYAASTASSLTCVLQSFDENDGKYQDLTSFEVEYQTCKDMDRVVWDKNGKGNETVALVSNMTVCYDRVMH